MKRPGVGGRFLARESSSSSIESAEPQPAELHEQVRAPLITRLDAQSLAAVASIIGCDVKSLVGRYAGISSQP